MSGDSGRLRRDLAASRRWLAASIALMCLGGAVFVASTVFVFTTSPRWLFGVAAAVITVVGGAMSTWLWRRVRARIEAAIAQVQQGDR